MQVPLLGKMTDAEMEMLVPEVELVTFDSLVLAFGSPLFPDMVLKQRHDTVRR